jgi:hypothetical protein
MKRISLIMAIALVSLFATASVSAQSAESALDEADVSLSIVEAVTTSAQVEVTIDGEMHVITVPVTINIDATKSLSDALLTSSTVDRVGDLTWKITAITEYGEEYELNNFNTLEPSVGNKLVVITSELTNLDSQPFAYWISTSDRFAYDDLGNLYEEADYECDDINPGDTRTCVLVFDVPTTANILGVDVKVTDHKRLPFATEK